jgi:hypothetical protein
MYVPPFSYPGSKVTWRVQDVKTKKEKCKLLVDRVVTITAAVTTELMKTDKATLAQLESSVVAFSGYVCMVNYKFHLLNRY